MVFFEMMSVGIISYYIVPANLGMNRMKNRMNQLSINQKQDHVPFVTLKTRWDSKFETASWKPEFLFYSWMTPNLGRLTHSTDSSEFIFSRENSRDKKRSSRLIHLHDKQRILSLSFNTTHTLTSISTLLFTIRPGISLSLKKVQIEEYISFFCGEYCTNQYKI